jgi:GT2 family glycosyltransferase
MFKPIKVVDIELSALAPIEHLDGCDAVWALVRLHGTPIGSAWLHPTGGRCSVEHIREAVVEPHSQAIAEHLIGDALATGDGAALASDLAGARHPADSPVTPTVTVAVCTRDRTTDLAGCLEAIAQLRYPALDVVVVDNAPAGDATERLVRERFPSARYVLEPRPGLDWARNRAIAEARGDIIAFADDDTVVDRGWAGALAAVFAENPDVMALTGLVVPYELETEAQALFEFGYGGWGRGFRRRWYGIARDRAKTAAKFYGGAGIFGTGANMAFRRSVFAEIGEFDPALDVGTVTNGGGDLEMFFRVIEAGHTLVYEPAAVVRHRHRREYAQLRRQLHNHGIGLYAYFTRSFLAHPQQRLAFLRLGVWWFCWWNVRRLVLSLVNPAAFPPDLVIAELWGSLLGIFRFRQARREAIAIGGQSTKVAGDGRTRRRRATPRPSEATGISRVEASRPFQPVSDAIRYDEVRALGTWEDQPLGTVDITNYRHPISPMRLRDAAVEQLNVRLVAAHRTMSRALRWAHVHTSIARRFGTAGNERRELDAGAGVSIVLATRDRPDDLRESLRCLQAQEVRRPVEVLVVDNNPASGLTPPVVAEFPGVSLLSEPRQGVAYARNKGFLACRGQVAVTVDDDVRVSAGWLEKLVAPLARSDVMAVTGNVVPMELDTEAQRLFESYGGLGRGFERLEVDGRWFRHYRLRAVPTWTLGATANAAFRTSIFHDPEIGLMDERLGPGTPTGVGEDTYLFYRVLAAGHTVVYEPGAYVWHRHRRDMRALRRQIYTYSKGHVAYHLTTLLRHRDLRALTRLAIELPWAHLWRIQARVRRRSRYPLSLLAVEILGNLAGPWTLWRSHRRVKRDGRSAAYVPVTERVAPPRPLQVSHAAGEDAAIESRVAN